MEREQGGLRIEVEAASTDADPEEATVVRLHGEFDMEAGGLLEETLVELIDGPVAAIVVDLHGLRFIDSTGLQALLRAAAHAREHGDKLRFTRGSSQVEDVMRVTRVADALPFVD